MPDKKFGTYFFYTLLCTIISQWWTAYSADMIYKEEVRDRLCDPLATNFKYRFYISIGKPVPIPVPGNSAAEEYKLGTDISYCTKIQNF